VAQIQIPTTFSWATMSIVVNTLSKLSLSLLPSKSAILNVSLSSVGTMNLARSLRSTGFMMNAYESTVMQTCGNISPIFSTTFLSQPLSTTRYSASTEVSPLVSIPSTIFELWIAYKRCHMRAPCAIFSGQIRMTDADGESLPGARGIPLVKISRRRSIITTA